MIALPDYRIEPRFLDHNETVQIPNYRNVFTGDNYVGCVVIHDGAWTPLYRTDDLNNPTTVDVMTRAAARLNGVS